MGVYTSSTPNPAVAAAAQGSAAPGAPMTVQDVIKSLPPEVIEAILRQAPEQGKRVSMAESLRAADTSGNTNPYYMGSGLGKVMNGVSRGAAFHERRQERHDDERNRMRDELARRVKTAADSGGDIQNKEEMKRIADMLAEMGDKPDDSFRALLGDLLGGQ